MATDPIIVAQLNANTAAINKINEDARKTSELPVMAVLDDSAVIRVEIGGISKQITAAQLNVVDTANLEYIFNKQDDLSYDGTGIKYPTVDAVNDLSTLISRFASKTGLLSKLDTFNLIALNDTTARIAPVQSCMFWNELFVPNTATQSAIRTFPQKDYPLNQLLTATGGNVNINPLTTDGKYVRYIGYDKNGNIFSSANSFMVNNDIFQIGFVTVLKIGTVISFLDGAAGVRNVFPQPTLASNTDFDKVAATTANITIAGNAGASINTSNGNIIGISVNWKSPANPSNGNPIDVFPYVGQLTAQFRSIDPTFLNGTAALSLHSLWTEIESGIAINQSFWNTTTNSRGTMANGAASVKRIMIGIRGSIYVQEGEHPNTACYADIAAAKNNIFAHKFSEAILPLGVAYEIARVAFVKGATAFQNDSQFYIVNTAGSSSGSPTVIPPVADATTASKGIVKLAGDLAGTADLPTVPALATKAPITGGTGYIQNQNAGAQSANMWINGEGIFDNLKLRRASLTTAAPLRFNTNGVDDWFIGQSPLGNSTRDLAFYSYGTNSVVFNINQTNGKIGIGNTNPAFVLDISGADNNGIRYQSASNIQTILGCTNTYGQVGTSSNHRLALIANVNEIMSLLPNGNVGIGTVNPQTRLNAVAPYYTGTPSKANSVAYFDNQGCGIYIGGNEYSYTYLQSEQTDNTNHQPMAINPLGGNVGIGNVNPLSKLTIAGALGGTVGAGGANFRIVNTDTGNYASIGAGIVGAENAGMEFSIDGVSKMVINPAGNVGISTTVPTEKLHVNGNIALGMNTVVDSPKNIFFSSNITDSGGALGGMVFFNYQWDNLIKAYIASYCDGALANAKLVFATSAGGTNAIERMRISANGNVLIGTTTDNGVDKLQVNGSGYFSQSVTVPTGQAFVLGDTSGTNGFFRLITNAGINYIQTGIGSVAGTVADLAITGNFGSGEIARFKSTGVVQIQNLSGTGTRTVVADASGNLSATAAAPTSGSYTPTITAGGNTSAFILNNASYTRIGNIVTVTCGVQFTTAAQNTDSNFAVSVPINRAGTILNYYVGHGFVNLSTEYAPVKAYFIGSNNGQIRVDFKSTAGAGNPNICTFTIQYDITQ